MKFDMNIKTKLTVSIGVLVAMIVLLVSLSVTNLQILTATEPDSPAAEPGMNRALTWIMIIGGICICIGLWILFKIPNSINSPFKSLVKGILEIANHNYDAKLDLRGDKELEEVSKNFNRMAKRLKDYHNSTISDLMASKRYLETIINSINEPIVGLDNEQIILFINNEALNILNLKREDVIRKSAQEIAMRNDLLRRLICGMWEDKKKEQEAPKSKRESLKIYADNKESYFQVKYMEITMRGNDGVTMEKRGDVIMLKNVTEFQELDTAKTTFISTVSHELKTPLTSISGYAEMIATGIAKEEDVQNFARRIHSESSRLLSLIADIIQLSELDYIEGRDDFENVDLLDLAHATENSLAPGAEKYGIVISVEGEHFQTFGCRSQLEELIYNLCDNAIRYNKRNGKVSVTVFGSEGRPAISVEDTGIGIPEDKLDRVFERFFRVDKGRSKRTGGTGLGLAIVKHIALRHGAQISISSELGKGTKITVVFEENKGENSD